MKLRYLVLGLIFSLGAYVAAVHSSPQAGDVSRAPRIGVSLSGAEFGTDKLTFSNRNPGVVGRDYTWNSPRTYQYFCERGLTLIRLPVRWERLQPRLGQDLDAAEAGRLRNAVARAKKFGGEVIIDLHNFGRYTLDSGGVPAECIVDQRVGGIVPVTRQHFADLWRRLSQLFRDEPAVYAYGLMNEPHDMGGSSWKQISQAAVDAIRADGDHKLILVAGDGWSKADHFAEINGAAWIADPTGNVAYEAHCYFDRDASGRYERSFDAELAADPELAERPSQRLQAFTRWCAAYHVRGFIGEFGVPGNDPRWLPLLTQFAAALRQAQMDGCYWGAGEWWNDYPLSIQPAPGTTEAAPQLAMLAH